MHTQAQEAPLRALILTSESGHPYPLTTPLLCHILIGAGMDVEMTEDPARLTKDLSATDVVVFHGRHTARNEAAEKALADYVAAGKGLAVLHIASNSFSGSEAFKTLVGGVWVSGVSSHPPYGKFRVTVTNAEHPVMAGIQDFPIEDEMYQKLVMPAQTKESENRVLATASDGQRTDPMVWIRTHGRGRVFHTTLGHGKACFQTPVYQKLVVQGVAWAAGRRM